MLKVSIWCYGNTEGLINSAFSEVSTGFKEVVTLGLDPEE